jgi:hypothetical protein
MALAFGDGEKARRPASPNLRTAEAVVFSVFPAARPRDARVTTVTVLHRRAR